MKEMPKNPAKGVAGTEKEHIFAICAYGESPYLEECIKSLRRQTVPSDVILATSTPSAYIERLCRKYHIPYFVNEGKAGITQDWNFAYKKATSPIVTIAHQDDVYFKNYTEQMLQMCRAGSKPLIFFSDYVEIRDGKVVRGNALLNIKRIMLLPLRVPFLRGSILARRMILAFGSPICCPSVAFFKSGLPKTVFLNHFRTNEDWEAWERISRLRGQFLYYGKPLIAHRIHKGSATTAAIQENSRNSEDLEMYRKFWPAWMAAILCRCYKGSERSNRI